MLLCFAASCLVLFALVAIYDQMLEASARNLALVILTKGLVDPRRGANKPGIRSLGLFSWLAHRDSTRYGPYLRRLEGLTETASAGNAQRSTRRVILGDAAFAAVDDALLEVVEQHLVAALHGTDRAEKSAFEDLSCLLDNQVGQSDNARYVPADSRNAPAVISVSDLGHGFSLIAACVEEQFTTPEQSTPIAIIWRCTRGNVPATTSSARSASWEWYRSSSFIFQWGQTPNLIGDGGFELTVLPTEGIPRQLPATLYTRQTGKHSQIVYEYPDIGQNMVLLLDGRGESPAGLGSLPIDIPLNQPEEAYLVTGRYRTVGQAEPRIGIRWLLRDAEGWSDNVSSYLVRQASDEWTWFADILRSYPQAEALQYWVLNADATSQLYVDDLGIFPITLPCPSE